MANVNESSKYTHFSNLEVGTATGGSDSGNVKVRGVQQGGYFAKAITGATTLTNADSGKVCIMNATDGATITLPTLEDGVWFKFVVGATFANTDWVVDSAEGDNINGTVVVNGASVVAAAEDQINFIATAETVGDWIEIIADETGAQWLVNGVGAAAGSITATDPT